MAKPKGTGSGSSLVGCLYLVGAVIVLALIAWLVQAVIAVVHFVVTIFPALVAVWFLFSVLAIFRTEGEASIRSRAGAITSATLSGLLALVLFSSKAYTNYQAGQHAHATAEAVTAVAIGHATEVAQAHAKATSTAVAVATIEAKPVVLTTFRGSGNGQTQRLPADSARGIGWAFNCGHGNGKFLLSDSEARAWPSAQKEVQRGRGFVSFTNPATVAQGVASIAAPDTCTWLVQIVKYQPSIPAIPAPMPVREAMRIQNRDRAREIAAARSQAAARARQQAAAAAQSAAQAHVHAWAVNMIQVLNK